MIGVFLSVALALLAMAGGFAYVRMRKPNAEPDYFMPMLTPSLSGTATDVSRDETRSGRHVRKVRAIDLEQVRSAGL